MSSIEDQKKIADIIKKINFYRNHPDINSNILEDLRANLERILEQLIQQVEGKMT